MIEIQKKKNEIFGIKAWFSMAQMTSISAFLKQNWLFNFHWEQNLAQMSYALNFSFQWYLRHWFFKIRYLQKRGWKGGWLLSVTWSCRICENLWFFTSLSSYTSQMTTWTWEPMFRKITPLSIVFKILFATIFYLVDTISWFFQQF